MINYHMLYPCLNIVDTNSDIINNAILQSNGYVRASLLSPTHSLYLKPTKSIGFSYWICPVGSYFEAQNR